MIIPFPRRAEPLSRRQLHALAKTVPCRDCGAPKGKSCTNENSPIIRLAGPHKGRIETAETEKHD